MDKRINVWIVDDAELVRLSLPELLNTNERIECTRCFENAETLLEALSEAGQLPDVLLLDIRLPRMSGLDAIPKVKGLAPQCKIIILTAYDECENVDRAAKEGAVGFLLKSSPLAEIITTIEVAQRGGARMDPIVLGKLLHMWSDKNRGLKDYYLTPREREIVTLAAQGLTDKEIAVSLAVSKHTVPPHFKNIYTKLDVHTRASLIAKVKDEKLL